MFTIRSIIRRFWNGVVIEQSACDGPDVSLVIAPGVRASEHSNGLVILHKRKGLVFRANRTGARIWRGLAEGKAPAAIASDLTGELGEPIANTLPHVADFVNVLRSEGLILAADRMPK